MKNSVVSVEFDPTIRVGTGGISLDSSTLQLSGVEHIETRNLTLSDNSVITTVPMGRLHLDLSNLVIDASSSINLDGMGYPKYSGPGAAEAPGYGSSGTGGGGYGGIGGSYYQPGGGTYGSALWPVDMGSGGANSGGGAIQLDVSDSLAVNGLVTADGYQSGSGGSILINANHLSGLGIIRANGGGGYWSGAGGGGRVAIYYHDSTFNGIKEAREAPTIYGSPAGVGTVVMECYPVLEFNATSYNVGEDTGYVTINVTRTGYTDLAASVEYSTSDGNATDGTNYLGSSGRLVFQPGERNETIIIPIFDDGIYAPKKYFNVSMTSPLNATIDMRTARVNIVNTDNAPVFQFNVSSMSVNDNIGTALLNVTKIGKTEMGARVSYTAVNGTANSGEDFTCSPGSLTFAPCETSKYILVTIIPDSAYEPEEAFNLVLNNPVDATIGTNQSLTVTISSMKVSFTYNLKKGWNLISIPVVPDDKNLITFFQPIMSNVSIVWEYNSSNGSNAWAYYTTMTDKYQQGTLRTVNEHLGYWVRCNNDTVFTISGRLPENSAVTLISGWNLIGNPTMDIRQPLAAYPNEKIVWMYNSSNTSSPWAYHTTMTEKYQQGSLTEMKPGYGYWVRI
jgi:hypothetical protein